MKRSILFTVCLFFVFVEASHSQNDKQIGLILHGGLFPEFRIQQDYFPHSTAYGVQIYYYDQDYTHLRFGFHYARGYHRSISYSPGLSVGYVIGLSESVSLTPGLGVMNYKMAERTCRISFRSIMNTIFDVDESCPDDSHGSLNLFLSSEIEIAEPFSIFFQTGYRIMHNSVRMLERTETETLPGGGNIERNFYKRENFLHGTGFEFGIGIKLDLF